MFTVIINSKKEIMLKNILSLNGAQALNHKEQKSINGGEAAECTFDRQCGCVKTPCVHGQQYRPACRLGRCVWGYFSCSSC